MGRSIDRTARRRARRAALASASVGALALLSRVPMTAASFTATTPSGGNSFRSATSFCASPGSTTTNVLNDTMVVQTSPSNNYASASPIEVRSHTNDNKRVLVRPSLPALGAHCRVTSAVLTFTVTNFRGGRTYDVYRAATDWSVNSVNWNNQPATAGTPASGAVTNTSWSIDVATQVQAIYDSGTNTGLIVRDSVEDSSADLHNSFGSLDGNKPATLTLTWG